MPTVAPNSVGADLDLESGGGPPPDQPGNVYLLTRTVPSDRARCEWLPQSAGLRQRFLKLSTTAYVEGADYFTMFNEVLESALDLDLGSGGAMLLPDLTDAAAPWSSRGGCGLRMETC